MHIVKNAETLTYELTPHAYHLMDFYDAVKATRNEKTSLTLVEIAGVLTDVFDEAERERLAALISPSK